MLRNVLTNWGGYFAAILISFFLSPYVVHHLGNSLYGVWTLIVSLTGYLGLLDLGVRGAVTRYVARFHAQGRHEDASRITSSAVVVFVLAGLLGFLISVGLAVFAVARFQIPNELVFDARVVVCLAGTTVASSLVGGVFGGVVVGLQRFELTNAVETAVSALRAVSIILALHWGGGIITLGVLQLVFSLAAGLVNVCISFKLYPELHLEIGEISRDHLLMIFSFGIYSFLLHAFSYLILYTDSVVIAAFSPVTMVTFFSIGGNLIAYSRQLIGGMTTPMTPLASQLEAKGQHAELERVTVNWSRYSTALVLAISWTFLIRGTTFIGLWMGPAYARSSGEVLHVLTFGFLATASLSVPWAVSFGLGKHKTLVPVYLIDSLANLGLSIALIKPLGIVGVAWGTTIPELCVAATFWPWYLQKVLRIPIWLFITRAWGPAILALLPFTLCTYGMEHMWKPQNVYTFFGQVGLAILAGIVGFWFMCVPEADRLALLVRLKTSVDRGVL